jgi:putative FmdB family regulatory protein
LRWRVAVPAYEYECIDCGQEFTAFLPLEEFEANPRPKCPRCGSDHVRRKFGIFYAKTGKKS